MEVLFQCTSLKTIPLSVECSVSPFPAQNSPEGPCLCDKYCITSNAVMHRQTETPVELYEGLVSAVHQTTDRHFKVSLMHVITIQN